MPWSQYANAMTTSPRVNLPRAVPTASRALNELDKIVRAHAAEVGLDAKLVELVKIRASQLNGCAACLDTHTEVAVTEGETAQRLGLIAAWPEAACFTPREKAALGLTESITLVANGNVSDEDYARAAQTLTDIEIAAIAWVVIVINSYNRIAIVGRHQVKVQPAS